MWALTAVLPPRPFLGSISLRAALVWGFLHVVSTAGGSAAGVPFPESLVGAPTAAPLIFAVVVIVMRVELWRRSELIFMANLGCSFGRVASFIILECAALETALRATLA